MSEKKWWAVVTETREKVKDPKTGLLRDYLRKELTLFSSEEDAAEFRAWARGGEVLLFSPDEIDFADEDASDEA